MTDATLNVPAISCEHCERAIMLALAPVPGVRSVAVDVAGKRVRVTYDEALVDIDRVKQILADEEYPVASASVER